MKARRKYADLTPLERQKVRARNYAGVYKRRGKLRQRPCPICGKTRRDAELHHPNYAKPLLVQWPCPGPHHRILDARKHARDRKLARRRARAA